MFKKAGKKTSKVLAYLLALMVMVGYVPAELLVTAMAADEATLDYNFIVTNGLTDDDLVEYEGATIVIKNGEELVGEVTTDENGEATAEGLEDATEYSYTVTLLGYEETTGSFTTDSATDPKEVNVTMTALQVATITGTVTDGTDAYEGATVTLSGYSEDSATTDENGEYTLSGYVGKAYTVTVTPKAEDEAKYSEKTSEIASATASETVDFVLVKNAYEITVSTNNTNDLTMGSVVIKDAATDTEIADLSNVDYGTEVIVEVTTEDGYGIVADSFKVDEEKQTLTEGKYTFTVKKNTTVSVEFEKTVFDLKIDANFEDEKGSIKFYKGNDEITSGKANKGDVITVKVDAKEAYLVKSMTINSDTYENTSEKEVTVNEDLMVNADFEAKVFEVEFFVTGNGTIEFTDDNDTIAGVVDVVTQDTKEGIGYNGELVFNVIANSGEGYHIESIESSSDNMTIDDTNDTTIGKNDCIEKTVTISEIKVNETVTVKFAINTYTVTLNNYVTGDGKVTVLINGLEVDVSNPIAVNHGDNIKLNLSPVRTNRIKKTVSIAEIGTYNCITEAVFDENWKWLSSKDGVLCTSDTQINVTFTNINQCTGSWSDYIEIVGTVDGQTIVSENDADGNYIYKSNNDLKIKLRDNVKYDNSKIKNIDYLFKNSEKFVGYKDEKIIEYSNEIVELQIHNGKEYSVNLDGKSIIFIIDKTAPEITVSDKVISNKDTDIEISVVDELTSVAKVVYTNESINYDGIDDTNVNPLIEENGKYKLLLEDEQNKTYYIYAVDTVNNISKATTVNVVIDKTNPTITNIEYEKTKTDITYKNDGIYCVDTIKLNVSVNDDNAVNPTVVSGINQVVLCCFGENGYSHKMGILVDGVATFELTEDDFKSGLTVELKVSDIAGNEITKKPSDFSGDDKIHSDYIIVSSAVSIDVGITSNLTATNDTNQTYSNGQNIWYKNSENIEVAITAKDELVGLKNIKVLVNDVDITDVNTENKDTVLCELNEQLSTGETITQISPVFVLPSELLKENEENTISVVITNNANGVTPEKEYKFFIDTTAPKTDKDSFKFSINNKENKPFENVLNILSFGAFFNEEIIITVETIDDENVSNSGLKSITLYKTVVIDEKTETSEIGKIEVNDFVNGKAKFTLPADVTKELKQFDAIISAKATDNVGNTTEEAVIPTTENSNIESEKLMIETVKPEISEPIITSATGTELKSFTADDKTWYNTDVDFAFSITDANSGIRSVEVAINGTSITKDKNGTDIKDDYYLLKDKTTDLKFVVSTSQAKVNEYGSYTLTVDVIDNAGNVAETKTVTVYKDAVVPEIDGFKFGGINDKQPCVETAEYGFYFKQDTKVTISATDATPTSGIKEITYYTVDVDSGKTDEVAEEVNENGEIEIEIEANFKGQIYAKVTDNVLNTSEFVSPDKTVVESEDKHAEETHITFKPEVDPTGKTSAEKDNDLYSTDVPVTITVIDTYSGIESIEWSVEAPYDTDNNQEGSVTVKNDGTLTDDSWDKTQEENSNLITKMSKTITVNNNSNDIVVKVTMTDRAGNTTTDDISFSIDKTAPVIEVTYDNNTPDAEYDSFYKANRTATIKVTERNFNPDDVKLVIENTDGVIPKLSAWTKTDVEDGVHPDGTVYTAKIDYVADGDYTFDIAYSDRATNDAEDFTPHAFTIDKTKPVVKVTYDNNKALNKNYYAAERIATITVKEHNFDASRIVVTGEAFDNGKKIKFPAITGWSSKGDVHTTTINYKADAKYTFDIKVTDKADNVDDSYKVETFFVDKTAPEVEITGVANNSANNGKVAPVVNYTDTNFTEDGVTVTLTGVNRGRVDYSRGVANVANGQTISYENFRNVKEVDDIYTLTAKVVDKAGNETTKSITFSVNRFGSTYNLEAVKSYNNKYIQSMGDLVFTEVNVNSLDLGNIRVKLTKNGTPSDLVMNQDFTVDVAGGGGRWYTYTYTIKSALFQDDAKYSLSFYSVDASGNVNENIDETKEAVVSFAVDKTKPVIIPIDLAEGERYKETVKNVTIEVKDNLLLEDVKIYLNDSEVEYKVEGESYTIQVPESPERQTIKIVAVDAAGNEYETTVKDILVSTNAFVQFVNNTPVFIGSIVAFVAVIGAIIAFIIIGKKKRRK